MGHGEVLQGKDVIWMCPRLEHWSSMAVVSLTSTQHKCGCCSKGLGNSSHLVAVC